MSDAPRVHPSNGQLAALKVGKLGPPESLQVEEHVAACDTCCEAMKTLPDDSLVKLLQEGTAPSGVPADSSGEGIHWPYLDEDISVYGLLAGKASGESQRSFQRWLESRANRKKKK